MFKSTKKKRQRKSVKTVAKVHPCEVAGFKRGADWGSRSIASSSPMDAPVKHSGDGGSVPLVPELSAMERFAARTPEEKENFFLVFSKLLGDELREQRRPQATAPRLKPDDQKTSTRPSVRIVNGVRFETASGLGGLTIISDAPLGPRQNKSGKQVVN